MLFDADTILHLNDMIRLNQGLEGAVCNNGNIILYIFIEDVVQQNS